MPYRLPRLGIALFSIAFLSACSGEKTADEYLESASSYLAVGEVNAALIETRNAVSRAPGNPEARALLGELELKVGNPSGAEAEFLKAAELGVPEPELAVQLAQSYFLTGKFDDLQSVSLNGLTDTERATILGYQSEAAFRQRKFTEAATLASNGLKANPVSAYSLTTKARLQLLENNVPSARTYLSTALDNTPDHAAGWELLGDVEAYENRLPEAINAYSRAISTAANVASPLFKRTKLHLAQNDLASAAEGVRIFEQGNVKAPGVRLLKAEIQLRERKLAEAQITLEDALRIAPDFQPAIRTLAVVHLLRGSLGQAEQFGKQYADETNSDDARILLAAIRLQANRLEQAVRTLQPLTDSGRLNILGAQVLATTQLKQNRVDDAVNTMLRMHADLLFAGITETPPLAMKSDPAVFMSTGLVGDEPDTTEEGDTETQPYLSEHDQLLIDAVEALAAEDIETALTISEKLLETASEKSDIHTLIARIHVAADDTQAASRELEKAISLQKAHGTAVIMAALLEASAGDSEAAVTRLEEAYSNARGQTRERLLIAAAKIDASTGNNDKALERLKLAKDANPASYQPSLAIANYYAQASEPKKVLQSLSGLSATGLQNPGVIELQTQAHIALQQFDKAIALATPMVQSDPDTPLWRYLRAKAHAGNNDIEAVNRDLDVALRIDPDHSPSVLAKANINILTNDLQQAEMQLTQLQALIPGSDAVNRLSSRFETARQQGSESADTGMQQGSESTGTDSPNTGTQVSAETESTGREVLAKAKSFWSNGEKQKAMATLADWLDTHPEDVTVRLTLANTYMQVDQPDDAISQYKAVLDVDDDNFIALNNLAWYLRDTDPQAAIDHATRAVQMKPDNVATLDTLAVIQLDQGMLSEAGRTFDRILALETTDPSILFHGAQIQAALGNKQNARKLLKPLIDGEISFPDAQAARSLYDDLQ